MKQEDIIRMAREAGGYLAELPNGEAWLFDEEEQLKRFAELVRADARSDDIRMAREAGLPIDNANIPWAELSAFAVAIRSDEREACAKAADEHMQECEGKSFGVGAAIRARGQA